MKEKKKKIYLNNTKYLILQNTIYTPIFIAMAKETTKMVSSNTFQVIDNYDKFVPATLKVCCVCVCVCVCDCAGPVVLGH